MIRTLARRAALAAVPLVTLGVPAVAGATSPAATLKVEPQAYLQPDGSALVTVDYSCTPGFSGSTGNLFMEMEQPGAIGSSAATATCDDRTHKATLDVSPGPFTPGSATANASMVGAAGTFTATDAEVKISEQPGSTAIAPRPPN